MSSEHTPTKESLTQMTASLSETGSRMEFTDSEATATHQRDSNGCVCRLEQTFHTRTGRGGEPVATVETRWVINESTVDTDTKTVPQREGVFTYGTHECRTFVALVVAIHHDALRRLDDIARTKDNT